MAGHGGDRRHREGDEVGDQGSEFGVHDRAERRIGLGQGEIVAVGEEFAVGGCDEDRLGGGGIGTDLCDGGGDAVE